MKEMLGVTQCQVRQMWTESVHNYLLLYETGHFRISFPGWWTAQPTNPKHQYVISSICSHFHDSSDFIPGQILHYFCSLLSAYSAHSELG